MAFTGAPTYEIVSDNIVRITGLSLAGAAVGILVLEDFVGALPAGAIQLPAHFKPEPYTSVGGATVSMVAALDVTVAPAGSVVTSVPIEVVKTGVSPDLWQAALTNTTVATASPALEIYVKFHT